MRNSLPEYFTIFLKFAMFHFSKCEYCEQLFKTAQGLQNHQSRSKAKNYGCHRLQILNQRKSVQNEALERKQNAKNLRLQKHHADVSMGPHPKGSPITAKEKRCILNLYQSYINEGKSNWKAKTETARRLDFGIQSIKNVIKEKLCEGVVHNNIKNLVCPNAYEKLAEEEINDLRKIVHTEMKNCNVIRTNTCSKKHIPKLTTS